ncbi:hypothetical protein J6590_006200 [Homalodisca vitripennis]|nr:hypothetical protein J6590_006200 [Homalodisca vitripennis]
MQRVSQASDQYSNKYRDLVKYQNPEVGIVSQASDQYSNKYRDLVKYQNPEVGIVFQGHVKHTIEYSALAKPRIGTVTSTARRSLTPSIFTTAAPRRYTLRSIHFPGAAKTCRRIFTTGISMFSSVANLNPVRCPRGRNNARPLPQPRHCIRQYQAAMYRRDFESDESGAHQSSVETKLTITSDSFSGADHLRVTPMCTEFLAFMADVLIEKDTETMVEIISVMVKYRK